MFKILLLKQLCVGSVTLNNIIEKNFPEEYAERKSEQDTLVHLGNESMPLFVMDVIIPCQKLSLHIFEPRYRLMVSSFKNFRLCTFKNLSSLLFAEIEYSFIVKFVYLNFTKFLNDLRLYKLL